MNGTATPLPMKKGERGYSCDGTRDEGRNGESFEDFCKKPEAVDAALRPEHVLP